MNPAPPPTVFTIGHSNHSMAQLLELLHRHGVTAVADVRSSPYSRLHPQFDREDLEASLGQNGIAYVFLGKQLGGRSDDPADYENGRVRYDRLAAKPAFASGIERLVRGTERHRIALLCAEKEPLDCHRTLLVAPALCALGVAVQHICASGELTGHNATMRDLRILTGLEQLEMFDPAAKNDEKRSAQAIALRTTKVGHTWTGPTADTEPDLR